jgi:23S rRNA pseudouridine1911/1915/1917 synthase
MAHRFRLEPEHPRERVDKVLPRLLSGVSRATVQRWIGEGRVLVDGSKCRPRDAVGAGSIIEVEPGAAPDSRAEPDASVRFGVLFEDDHLVVVDKPAGLVVHPARGHRSQTLVNGLLARAGFRRAPADPGDPQGALRPGVVHRIDKDTSGIIVVAKDEPTREGLKEQLSAHSVERQYRAITCGVPDSRTIATCHGRHPRSRLRFTSRLSRGRAAVTRVVSVEPLAAGRAALVRCELQTGRTHQIRVHLAEQAGTPVLADPLYGRPAVDPQLSQVANELGRQALHAAVLGFVHPISGDVLRIESPLPSDMQQALRRLREGQ